jgi:hypothetical protein
MSEDKPDYVHCVKTGYHNDNKSWCGRIISMEWVFTDTSHAALNARNEGRLLICPDCSKKIIEVIRKGTWNEERNRRSTKAGRDVSSKL